MIRLGKDRLRDRQFARDIEVISELVREGAFRRFAADFLPSGA